MKSRINKLYFFKPGEHQGIDCLNETDTPVEATPQGWIQTHSWARHMWLWLCMKPLLTLNEIVNELASREASVKRLTVAEGIRRTEGQSQKSHSNSFHIQAVIELGKVWVPPGVRGDEEVGCSGWTGFLWGMGTARLEWFIFRLI